MDTKARSHEVEELFVAGNFEAALALSERLRAAGVMTPKLAMLQAVCLDQIGHAEAATTRLDELSGAVGRAAEPLLALTKPWLGTGKRAHHGLRADALRFVPKLTQRGSR